MFMILLSKEQPNWLDSCGDSSGQALLMRKIFVKSSTFQEESLIPLEKRDLQIAKSLMLEIVQVLWKRRISYQWRLSKKLQLFQTQRHNLKKVVRVESQVDAVWEQMNKGVSVKVLKSFTNKPSSTVNRTSTVYDIYMGLGPKKRVYLQQDVQQKGSSVTENSTNDEVKRLAAAALSAVRMLQQLLQAEEKLKLQRYGTLRVEIEVKKLVDASEEASERAKGPAGTASAADHARQDKKGWG
eukprot:XP_019075394.1 PREDICTED: uncharacterized protein LOC100853716 isoform X6 [Vitis vinifera]